MLFDYLLISLCTVISTLVSVLIGYTLAKSWLDKRFGVSRPTVKLPPTPTGA